MVVSLKPAYLTAASQKVITSLFKILSILFPFDIIDYDATRKKDEASYEYYIHYENINRRND